MGYISITGKKVGFSFRSLLFLSFILLFSVGVSGQTPIPDTSGYWSKAFNVPDRFDVHDITKFQGKTVLAGADTVVSWDPIQEKLTSLGKGIRYRFSDGTTQDAAIHAVLATPYNLYIGGYFNELLNPDGSVVKAKNIARWDGLQWHSVGEGLDGQVYALARDSTYLYAGGDGYAIPGAIQRWDGSQWSSLAGGLVSGDDSFSPVVYSLKSYGSYLYTGGFFAESVNTDLSRVQSPSVIRWNPDSSRWEAMNSGATGSGSAQSANRTAVRTIASSRGHIYIGGNFDQTGSISATNVGKWDTTGNSWESIQGLDETVLTLAVQDSLWLYAGGEFYHSETGTQVNQIARRGIQEDAAWEAIEQTDSRLGLTFNGVRESPYQNDELLTTRVRSIYATASDSVWVGGDFEFVGNRFVNGITLFEGTTSTIWRTVTPGKGIRGSVQAVEMDSNNVYVGGNFSVAGNQLMNGVARYDRQKEKWFPLGVGIAYGAVFDLTLRDDELFIAGHFDKIVNTFGDTVQTGPVARWSATSETWQTLLTGAFEVSGGALGRVWAITHDANNIYIGGDFSSVDGVDALSIAQNDGNQWKAMAPGHAFNNEGYAGVNGIVTALHQHGSSVYVGGGFSGVDTLQKSVASHIARWDGTRWHAMGQGVIGTAAYQNLFSTSVKDIESRQNMVYVAGEFGKAVAANGSDVNSKHIAAWNTSDNTWDPVNSGFQYGVDAVTTLGADIYVGYKAEDPSNSSQLSYAYLARWDGSGWQADTTRPLKNILGSDGEIYDIAAMDKRVFIGGLFDDGPFKASHFTRFTREPEEYVVWVNIKPDTAEVAGNQTNPQPGHHTVSRGSNFQIQAHSASGWNFMGWSGANTAGYTDSTLSITVRENMNLTAHFAKLKIDSIRVIHLTNQGYKETGPLDLFPNSDKRITVDGNPVIFIPYVTFINSFGAEARFALTEQQYPDTIEINGDNVYQTNLDPGRSKRLQLEWGSDGMAWKAGGNSLISGDDKSPHSDRDFKLRMTLEDYGHVEITRQIPLVVIPKPVILVHGLWSTHETWNKFKTYIKDVHPWWRGYAVGDDHTFYEMNTGERGSMRGTTTTIAGNSTVMSLYTLDIMEQSQALHANVVAHSMGGLISRHYVQELMDVALDDQTDTKNVITLGTPNLGSPCATAGDLIASGVELASIPDDPTVLEDLISENTNLHQLMPSFLKNQFNPAINKQRGIPFYGLAGNTYLATCGGEDGDLVVEFSSALAEGEAPPDYRVTTIFNGTSEYYHMNLTKSRKVFDYWVKPILDGGAVPQQDYHPPENPPAPLVTTESISAQRQTESATNDIFYTKGVKLGPSETKSLTIAGESADRLLFKLTADTTVTSRLSDEQGSVVDTVTAGSIRSRSFFRSHQVSSNTGQNWQLELENKDSDSSLVRVTGRVFGAALQVKMDTLLLRSDDRLPLSVTVTSNNAPVTGATIEGALISTDTSFTAQKIELQDDGQHNDGVSGDGEYGGLTEPLKNGGYSVVLIVKSNAGNRLVHQVVRVTDGISVSIPEESISQPLPEAFKLHANYPNPFNPGTTLRFDLPEKQYVRITIYNVLGQKIRTLLDKSMQAGRHHVRFDASDLTSGIYIYVIQTENEASTGKMLLLK